LVDINREFEGLELSKGEVAGYQIVKQQVTFYGYCPKCKGSKKCRGVIVV
jgi:Fe2+ or Zn2+ uptake regulation protein